MIRRILLFFFVATGSFAEEIHFLVMPEKVIGPISPYIYGLNSQDPTGTGATFRRAGGNRTTAYNWVTNYSNAGNDYRHVNDNWPCTVSGYTDCDQVGAQTLHFVEENLKDHVDTLISVPMVDYVSADRNMDVTKEETAPSKRFKRNLYQKKGPFTLTPDPSAPAVYQDEFVNFLVNRFHTAAQGGVKFYSLDNEPDLWSDTHPRVHPEKITYAELADRSERLATAILGVDPTAQILGFISYGWMGFTTLQDASDRKEYEADFPTFIDYFLDKMKQAEARHKKRLVHILDLHWYPEAQGDGKRITDKGTSSGLVEARLQAPRSLWDPTYTEKSWIADNLKKPIQLLPMVQSKIAERYPGTKLGITEYDYGAGGHVSGGMAQADALGAFGKGNVYMASYWGDLKPYNKAALRIYRNYDGKGAVFGDHSVSAATEDVSKTSIYASTDPKRPGRVWVLVLNKDQKNSIQGKFKIQGEGNYQAYETYGFDGKSPEIRSFGKGTLQGNQFGYDLPPLSAVLFVCRTSLTDGI